MPQFRTIYYMEDRHGIEIGLRGGSNNHTENAHTGAFGMARSFRALVCHIIFILGLQNAKNAFCSHLGSQGNTRALRAIFVAQNATGILLAIALMRTRDGIVLGLCEPGWRTQSLQGRIHGVPKTTSSSGGQAARPINLSIILPENVQLLDYTTGAKKDGSPSKQ